jgi:hypothetical protein
MRKAHHEHADHRQDGRIDARRDHLLAHPVELLLVGDVAPERLGHAAGALGGLDGGHVQRREVLREGRHRLRERLAAVERGEDAGEHFLALAGFLVGERLQRLDQVQPRLEQRGELDGEQRGGKLPAPRERKGEAGRFQRDERQALPARLLGGERRVGRLELQADYLLARI